MASEPLSQKIALPAQSEGSIRLLGVVERQRVQREDERAKTRPQRARVVIALVTLAIGGLTILYAQAPPHGASHASREAPR